MMSNDIRRAVLSRPLAEVRIFHRRWKTGLVYHPVVSEFLRSLRESGRLDAGMNYGGLVWPLIFSRTAAALQRRREQAEAAHRAEMARRRQLAVQLLDSSSYEAIERIVAEHGGEALAAFKSELARWSRWGEQPLPTIAFIASEVLGVAHELRDEEAKRDEKAASARRWARRAEEEDDDFFFHFFSD
jgi:hypothetical protein